MHKQGYARSVLIAGLVIAGLAVANSSFAAPKTTGGTTTGTGTGAGGGAKHGGLLKALHEARELLVHAEHDYDGHRAKAVHLVTEAIHKLKPPPVAKASVAAPVAGLPKPKTTPAPSQPSTMTQAESDHHLHQASEIIKKVQPHVQDAHPEAAAHLADAVVEIATALSIK